MPVSTVENVPITAKKCNQSGSDFTLFNQKHNKTHFREHLETQYDDTFDSRCTRTSTENETIINDRTLDPFCTAMDPNQPLPTFHRI